MAGHLKSLGNATRRSSWSHGPVPLKHLMQALQPAMSIAHVLRAGMPPPIAFAALAECCAVPEIASLARESSARRQAGYEDPLPELPEAAKDYVASAAELGRRFLDAASPAQPDAALRERASGLAADAIRSAWP